jgi:hypothetical protein
MHKHNVYVLVDPEKHYVERNSYNKISNITRRVNDDDETTSCICSKRKCTFPAYYENILYIYLLNSSNVPIERTVHFRSYQQECTERKT